MNDIQQGLQYENISYTKEQNEKLLNEVETSKINETEALAKVTELEGIIHEMGKAHAVYINTTYDVDWRQEFSVECFSEDVFLNKHAQLLKESLEIKESNLHLRLKFKNQTAIIVALAVAGTITSVLALVLWIFF